MSSSLDPRVPWHGVAKPDTGIPASDLAPWETSQRTVYVATTGNDTTGDGTAVTPWATVQHAVNQAKSIMQVTNGASGYKVLVSPGTYVENVAIPPNALGGMDTLGNGGIHIESTTANKADVILRSASGLIGIDAFGMFALRHLTIEADTYAVLVRGGRHVTGLVRDVLLRRTSLSNGPGASRAIFTQFGNVVSWDVSSEAGRLFGYGLRADLLGLIVKGGTIQPAGALANESTANGGVVR